MIPIRDIHPGYLNNPVLLLELSNLQSLLKQDKRPVSAQRQDHRWVAYRHALAIRHNMVVAEVQFRQLADDDVVPLSLQVLTPDWPDLSPTSPFQQIETLQQQQQAPGRIPLPNNAQQIWRQHKYSVMARDVNLYRRLGREVAGVRPEEDFSELCLLLTDTLRKCPTPGGVRNALQHLWGYVSDSGPVTGKEIPSGDLQKTMTAIQINTLKCKQIYLLSSTALTELGVWI